MGRAKRTRKYAATKRVLNPNDGRLKLKAAAKADAAPIVHRDSDKKKGAADALVQRSELFFSHNRALGPPFHVLLDTNFLNMSVVNKLEIARGMLDCLAAAVTIYISDCVMAELQKLGPKFRIALRLARDKTFVRLPCTHKGTYADDCIVDRVTASRIYIVATCDRDLRRRLRKVPGVPIMYISSHKYTVERLPEAAFLAPR